MKQTLVIAIFVLLFALFANAKKLRDDPADSWLAYVQASGNDRLITYVNATWTVPQVCLIKKLFLNIHIDE
jgi:hypothetical protein